MRGGQFTDWIVSRGLSGEMLLSGVLKEPLAIQLGQKSALQTPRVLGVTGVTRCCPWPRA